jgi:hypothetical protein
MRTIARSKLPKIRDTSSRTKSNAFQKLGIDMGTQMTIKIAMYTLYAALSLPYTLSTRAARLANCLSSH